MTYTHLTVGTSRIPSKPPRSQPPCVEPYITGANILKDPGFELQLSNFGGGEGSEIPQFASFSSYTLPYEWEDGSSAGLSTFWSQRKTGAGFAGTDRYWQASTTNPRTGTYHARLAMGTGTPINQGQTLVCSQIMHCAWQTDAIDLASAIVVPGDFIRFGAWISVNDITDAPRMLLEVDCTDDTWTFGGTTASFYEDFTLAVGYNYYEVSGFVPATTRSAIAYFQPWHGQTFDTTYFDVANAVLEVS